MKKFVLVLLIQVCAFPSLAENARHVLIVANNLDPSGELPPLRYADDDGVRFNELFYHSGARVELLTTMDAESQKLFPDLVGRTRPPTRSRMEATLSRIFEAIRQDKAEGMPTEFVFVFTGHGKLDSDGNGQLLLADGAITREEFLDLVVSASPADYNHLIIDACHAYYLVLSRGDWKDDRGGASSTNAVRAYLQSPDLLSRHPTTGVILSTSGTAEVHEWERYRSGVFSHELRSGMLGPADVNNDGQVDYGELEAFISAANAGVSNPRARIQVFVQAPLQNLNHPLIDLRNKAFTHFIRFPKSAAGHFEVEDSRGLSYTDWNKAPDHDTYLALLYPPVKDEPSYFIRRGDRELTVRLSPPGKGTGELRFDETSLEPVHSASRSSVADSFRKELFSVPFGRAFAQGFSVHRERELTTESRRSPSPKLILQHSLSAAYALSDALLDSDDIAQGASIAYRWSPWRHFHLAFRFGWRYTHQGPDANSHTVNDFELFAGGGAHWDFLQRVRVLIGGALGNHFIGYNRENEPSEKNKAHFDNFAPAVEFSAGVLVLLYEPLFLEARAHVAAIFANVSGEEEKTFFRAGATLALGLAF